MNMIDNQMFWIFASFITAIGVAGFYCIFVSDNLIRILIGIELVMKAVTLFIILVGRLIGQQALAQVIVITFIVFEVFFITIACGVVLSIYSHTQSLDIRKIKNKNTEVANG
jgi:NADH-quinone oxidoreductase subunit K